MKATGSFFRNRALNQMLSLATGLAIVLACAPGTALAQARGTSPQKAAADTGSARDARSQGGGQQEGIKVHGHWTIEVRNPDGTIAARREFENALDTGAGAYLATVLARGATFGRWAVFINSLSGGGICLNPSGNPDTCGITEPFLFSGTFSHISPTLSVSAPQSGPDAGMFVLSGSTRAAFTGTIEVVGTHFSPCPATSAPASPCASGGVQSFTNKILASGIPVVAGQTIDVTVKIRFL